MKITHYQTVSLNFFNIKKLNMKTKLIGILILLTFNTNAQQWEQIKSLNNVRKIAVAENGDIWTTTLSGVVHYNGEIPILYDSINTTSLLNAFWINDMEFDYDGNIWVATTQGFGKFNGVDWEGLYYPPRLGSAYIKDIEIGYDNSVWFGVSALDDREGLTKFDGKNWQTWGETNGLISHNVNVIATDSTKNTVWIGTSRGISVLDGNSFTSYTKDDGLIANDVKVIKIDMYGNKWIGTSTGLSVFDDTTWVSYQESDGLISSNIIDIEINTDNNIWVATVKGISVFDGIAWTNYNEQDLLFTNIIYDLTQNNEGNILAATDVGILKYNGTKWTTHLKDTTLASTQIIDIKFDSSDIWIATTHGISIFNNGNWKNYNAQNGLLANNVNSIVLDNQNNKWVATGNGICKFDGLKWNYYNEEDGLISNNVWDIAIDSSQNLWFGTDLGISKFDGSNWTKYNTEDGLSNNYVRCVFADNLNNIWAGTSRGISKFDGEKWDNVSNPSGPWESSSIRCIEQDINGNIWFGTENQGLWLFDGGKWQHITSINGLDFNRVYAIKKDVHNNIWLGSYSLNGLKIFNGTEWYGYSDKDGLADMNISCINFGTNGDAYFGEIGAGLTILQQPKIPIAVNLSKDSLTIFTDEASSDTLSLTTFAAWKISCDEDWVSFMEIEGDSIAISVKSSNYILTEELNGEGNSAVIIHADANPTSNERSATITISAYGEIIKTIPIVQAGKTTAINEIVGFDINVYPNPVKNALYIQTPTDFSPTLFEIYSFDGRILHSSRQQNKLHEIDMKSFLKGTYLLRISSSNNIKNLKIVKQ